MCNERLVFRTVRTYRLLLKSFEVFLWLRLGFSCDCEVKGVKKHNVNDCRPKTDLMTCVCVCVRQRKPSREPKQHSVRCLLFSRPTIKSVWEEEAKYV